MEKTVLGPPIISTKVRPTSSDEKAPDSSDNAASRRVGWPKGKKRKKVSWKGLTTIVSYSFVSFSHFK